MNNNNWLKMWTVVTTGKVIDNLKAIDCNHTANAVAKILEDEERKSEEPKGLSLKQLKAIIDEMH